MILRPHFDSPSMGSKPPNGSNFQRTRALLEVRIVGSAHDLDSTQRAVEWLIEEGVATYGPQSVRNLRVTGQKTSSRT